MKVYVVVDYNNNVTTNTAYKEKEQAERFAYAFSTPIRPLLVLEYEVK